MGTNDTAASGTNDLSGVARPLTIDGKQATLVLGVIGQDVHIIGLQLLEVAFRDAGFNVVSLGIMVSQEEFVAAAIETDACAVLVSSIYGHGELDCEGLRDKCVEAGIGDIKLFTGGNLVIGKRPWDDVRTRFIDMGFDDVYPPGVTPSDAVESIRSHLEPLLDKDKEGR